MTSQPDTRPRVIIWRTTYWPWLFAMLIFAAVYSFDYDNLWNVAQDFLAALGGTLQYIIFAVILIGWLAAAGAQEMIAKVFEGRQTQAIFAAALFGGLAPFCSCEVIPLIAALLAAGAPLPAVMAFWLASPLIDPPTLLITAAALGWQFAIFKAAVAIGLGLFGGFLTLTITRNGGLKTPLKSTPVASCCGSTCGPKGTEWAIWKTPSRLKTFKTTTIENFWFLLRWMTLAYAIEALMIHYIPSDLIASTLGGQGLAPIALGAFVGVPAYLNSYVAPPLVAGLTGQGMQLGAGMSFIIAGAITSVPAMAAVWSLVKPKVFGLYLSFGLIGAITSGVIYQLLV